LRTNNPAELVKSRQTDGFAKSSPAIGGTRRAIPLRAGLRSEAHLQVRRNDEVAAQSRSERNRWTFYETIILLNQGNAGEVSAAPNILPWQEEDRRLIFSASGGGE